ncbi:MAG: hypothetical protein ABIX28_25725 [Vicinamibacterales bacterium]
MPVCFCTLAVHAPYRARARRLCAASPHLAWVVLTDDPSEFAGLPVHARFHQPTGPMAQDYLDRLGETGNGRGAAAYHDKRFVLKAALERFDTAIFLDADSQIGPVPSLDRLPPGLAIVPLVRKTIADHLSTCGTWRLPAFEQVARELFGGVEVLHAAPWCHETCYAVTRDGREPRFFEAWDQAAGAMQRQGVFSGEGGVMGLAAAFAGWTVDYDALDALFSVVSHEGGGPKGR